MTRNFPG
ncbi:hypothetical protein AYI69_g4548, partial [Smittium culicis]